MSWKDERARQGQKERGAEIPDAMIHPEPDEIQRLLKTAGPRPVVPPHLMSEIRNTAEAAWQEKVRTHRAASRMRFGAMAAAIGMVAVGLAVTWWALQGGFSSTSTDLATVVAAFSVEGPPTGEAQPAFKVGDVLTGGTVVETASGERLVLQLAGGAVVRLDERSRLSLMTPDQLTLEGGAVYADAEPGRAGGLLIGTPFGAVRDIGTRFEVRLFPDSLRIQVRQGEVRLETAEEEFSAAAGTALVLRDGNVEAMQVDPDADSWGWLREAPEPFDLEGRSLQDFLAWAARETGKEVRFVDPELEQRASGITTHGTIAGLSPMEAMDLVLPSSGLRYRSEAGVFFIEKVSY